MSKGIKWLLILLALDIAISTVLLTMMPDKTQQALTCLSDLTK